MLINIVLLFTIETDEGQKVWTRIDLNWRFAYCFFVLTETPDSRTLSFFKWFLPYF